MRLCLLLSRLPFCACVAFCMTAPRPALAQSNVRFAVGFDNNNWKSRGGRNPEANAFSNDFIHNLRLNCTVDLRRASLAPLTVTGYFYSEFMIPLDFNDGGDGTENARQFLKLFQYPGAGLGARVRVGPLYVSAGLGAYLFFPPTADQSSHSPSVTAGGRLFVGYERGKQVFYEVGTSVADFRRNNFTPGVSLQIGVRL